jgi:SAM-dependent methyltransferase
MLNKDNYEMLYKQEKAFLRYPADWVLRFNNMYLKSTLPPKARILDFGCGSGNNSTIFIAQGHEVFGIDVTDSIYPLIKKNLELHSLDPQNILRFTHSKAPLLDLPYEDNSFDFILSNQVHYYSSTEREIHAINKDLFRILKPGGTIFVTMMGLKNYYITHHLKELSQDAQIYKVRITDPSHRLFGVSEDVLAVRDQDHLRDLFNEFETVTVGYFDQSMFDLHSNFHFIYVGCKPHL